MSASEGTTEAQDFIGYWESEGAAYARRGDYAWMADRLSGLGTGTGETKRVLEIGCGVGFGTEALLSAGHSVLAVDILPACLTVAEARAKALGLFSERATFQLLDVEHVSEETRASLEAFAPNAVVCWLMGAPQDMTGASEGDAGRAVAQYRERLHRVVASLSASLASVRLLHLVDRTVIPWQAKDLARDTLVRYHLSKTTLDLPWQAVRADALYRKMAVPDVDLGALRQRHAALKSATPALASLCLRRTS